MLSCFCCVYKKYNTYVFVRLDNLMPYRYVHSFCKITTWYILFILIPVLVAAPLSLRVMLELLVPFLLSCLSTPFDSHRPRWVLRRASSNVAEWCFGRKQFVHDFPVEYLVTLELSRSAANRPKTIGFTAGGCKSYLV